jgi:hypothetical protein
VYGFSKSDLGNIGSDEEVWFKKMAKRGMVKNNLKKPAPRPDIY